MFTDEKDGGGGHETDDDDGLGAEDGEFLHHSPVLGVCRWKYVNIELSCCPPNLHLWPAGEYRSVVVVTAGDQSDLPPSPGRDCRTSCPGADRPSLPRSRQRAPGL